MKRIIILTLFVISNFTIYSQTNVEVLKFNTNSCNKYFYDRNSLDSNFSGIDTTVCVSHEEKITIINTYKNGEKTLIEGFYDNGIRYGYRNFNKEQQVIAFWNKDGDLDYYEYSIDKQIVLALQWFENGSLRYVNDINQKNTNDYNLIEFDTLGNVIRKTQGIGNNNKLKETVYYPDLEKMTEAIYNDAKQEYIAYYKSQKIMMKGYIYQVMFARVGKWQEWYESGVLKREYFFNENIPEQREGTWKYWDESGRLEKEEVYENGTLVNEKKYIKDINKRTD